MIHNLSLMDPLPATKTKIKINVKKLIKKGYKCEVCLDLYDKSWKISGYGCCAIGICRECKTKVSKGCPGCREPFPQQPKLAYTNASHTDYMQSIDRFNDLSDRYEEILRENHRLRLENCQLVRNVRSCKLGVN